MLTLMIVLALAALVTAIAALANKCPVTVPVLILAVIAVIYSLPVGK